MSAAEETAETGNAVLEAREGEWEGLTVFKEKGSCVHADRVQSEDTSVRITHLCGKKGNAGCPLHCSRLRWRQKSERGWYRGNQTSIADVKTAVTYGACAQEAGKQDLAHHSDDKKERRDGGYRRQRNELSARRRKESNSCSKQIQQTTMFAYTADALWILQLISASAGTLWQPPTSEVAFHLLSPPGQNGQQHRDLEATPTHVPSEQKHPDANTHCAATAIGVYLRGAEALVAMVSVRTKSSYFRNTFCSVL
eukprot:1833870-Rhodomonas_salina.1